MIELIEFSKDCAIRAVIVALVLIIALKIITA